jgi:DNA-binding transcriptional regulator YdaS (Cro superfamily)
MEKKKVKAKKRLTAVEVKVIMESWGSMSIDEIAGQLGVTPNTVRMMVSSIRKVDPEKCPPKPRTRKVREDVVREALALLNSVAA